MRKQSISATKGIVSIGATINYGYDNASRINSVGDGANTAKYGYVADSSLLDSTTFTSGVNQRLVTKRVFDSLNRLRSIQSSPSTGTPVRFDYQYNSANQRERVYLEDGSYWDYRYDSMGQLRTGRRYWKDGKPVAGQQFEYGFDDIGNRTSAKSGGDQNGQNLRLSSYDYGANLLNQPQNRTVPGSIDVSGVAPVAGTLTVNGVAPDHRRGEYFWRSLPVANGSAAVQQNVSLKLNTTAAGSGNVFVPQSPESYTYDDDGNLTSDGRWKYSWDAENRLVGMLDISKTATDGLKMVFEYDFNSRRISKTVTGGGSASSKTVYVYDGWNLIAELDGTSFAAKRTYAWGLDLSGNLTGAGGVGGLLWVNVAGNGTHFVSYDGNGNVIGLNSATDGSNTARYEYGPFGEPIRATGTRSADNPIRFSSKYTDAESGLVYYGYRYYNAVTGRWINRDPIEELGGKNLYVLCANSPTLRVDFLGLEEFVGNPIVDLILKTVFEKTAEAIAGLKPSEKTTEFDVVCPAGCERQLLKEQVVTINRFASLEAYFGNKLIKSMSTPSYFWYKETTRWYGCCSSLCDKRNPILSDWIYDRKLPKNDIENESTETYSSDAGAIFLRKTIFLTTYNATKSRRCNIKCVPTKTFLTTVLE